MFKAALIRFVRVVGGQVLGAAITATLAYLTTVPGLDTGQGVVIATVIGSALTAADKYLREKGVYGG